MDKSGQELEDAQDRGDFARASELKYGQLPALEQKLREEERRLAEKDGQDQLVKKEVDEQDIAQVLSRWTGIPVSKLLSGEVEELLHLSEELHRRGVAPEAGA